MTEFQNAHIGRTADVVVQRRVLPWLDVEKRSGDGG